MMTLTVEEPLGTNLDSCYGHIRYEEWCKHEVERLNQAGIYAEVHYLTNAQGKCCCVLREIDDALRRAIEGNFKFADKSSFDSAKLRYGMIKWQKS